MFENIGSILKNQCGLDKDRYIVAGVSGGPDSLCLMGLLREHGYRVIVAHFNHKLRADADADANAVEQAAARMNFIPQVESGDVREFANKHKMSLEEAARVMRYSFIMEKAREYHAQAVAVGHTADDQAETVLMHFIRGAGITGLTGMNYRTILPMFDENIPIVRPLLDVWREETVVYCAVHKLQPRYDLSNDSLDFFRNRLRHLLIPSLETYNPRFREAIWRASRSLAADYEVLTAVVDQVWEKCIVHQTTDYISFDVPLLTQQPLGLQRHLIRRAVEALRPGGLDVNFAALERATDLINNPEHPPRIDLTGGLRLIREGDTVYLSANLYTLPIDRWPQMSEATGVIPLKVPCSVKLPGGWTLVCELWNIASLAMEQARSNENPFQAWLDADGILDALELRTRQDGDRFEPLGMNGHEMKISDIFINIKVPHRVRDRIPLLCMGEKVLWVPGYRPAHSFRLTTSTRRALYFSITRN